MLAIDTVIVYVEGQVYHCIPSGHGYSGERQTPYIIYRVRAAEGGTDLCDLNRLFTWDYGPLWRIGGAVPHFFTAADAIRYYQQRATGLDELARIGQEQTDGD